MDGRTDGLVGGLLEGWIEREKMYGEVDAWTYGWDGWIMDGYGWNGWMDGWMGLADVRMDGMG